jgi:hypothetical protein
MSSTLLLLKVGRFPVIEMRCCSGGLRATGPLRTDVWRENLAAWWQPVHEIGWVASVLTPKYLSPCFRTSKHLRNLW